MCYGIPSPASPGTKHGGVFASNYCFSTNQRVNGLCFLFTCSYFSYGSVPIYGDLRRFSLFLHR
jgi:hypothetical protein